MSENIPRTIIPKKSHLNVADLLKDNTYEIMDSAIEQAKRGNSAVLTKLIDKIMPNINLNIDAGVFNPETELEIVRQMANNIVDADYSVEND